MSRQTRPSRADKNAMALARKRSALWVANAAQLRLSLVVQNVDWRWRKSHQNKNRTAPRPTGRERLAEVSPCRPGVSHRWHTFRDTKGQLMRVHARLPTPLGSLRRFFGIRGCAATPRG